MAPSTMHPGSMYAMPQSPGVVQQAGYPPAYGMPYPPQNMIASHPGQQPAMPYHGYPQQFPGPSPHLPQQHMLLASTAHGATPPPPYRAPPSFDQAYRIVHGGTTQFQQAM